MDDILLKAAAFLGSEEGESPHYDTVVLQMSSDGKLQATRSQLDREKNPDRISLDRRGLTKVPQLTGEPRLRLLSLQHNLITRVDNLSGQGLSRLVFLDLYDNQLERISGLEGLENLRVLLMGKNRIRRIEGLGGLAKLEVLDLHGNRIHQVTGLGAQGELKVLNLAGNQIRAVGTSDLRGLRSLLELNLRRNRLRRLLCFGETPQLRKLFLSNNELQSVDCMSSVTRAANLTELAVDGNPLALGGDCVSFLVSSLPKLKLLSNLEVSEAVRKAALSWRGGGDGGGGSTSTPEASGGEDVRREEVICNARTNWELLRSQTCGSLGDERCVQSDSGVSVSEPDPSDFFRLPPIPPPAEGRGAPEGAEAGGSDSLSSVEPNVDSSLSSLPSSSSDTSSGGPTEEDDSSEDLCGGEAALPAAGEDLAGRAAGAQRCRKHGGRRAQPRASTGRAKGKASSSGLPGRVREQGGDFLVEICGRCLNVVGQGALRFLDRPWNSGKAAEVSAVRFTYVSFNSAVPLFGRLKLRFPNLEHFAFLDTNIHCLGQLNALADVQGLTSLQIERQGNPVTSKDWQKYAVYRLHHWGLRVVNGKEITEEDVTAASEEFKGLSDVVLWSLPDTLLQPLLSRLHLDGNRSSSAAQNLTAKQWLWSADPALRSVVGKEALQWRRGSLTQEDVLWRHKGRVHLAYLLELAISAVEKLHLLEAEWPDILAELVRDTLVDYSHLDSYMKKCIQSLKI